jgi:hypothetical protein
MARMIRLDPAPKKELPRDGWELVATEAGRYATGLRATLQVWNGDLQGTRQLPLAHPERWDDFITELAGLTEAKAEEITKILFTLIGGIEGALRAAEAQAEARGISQATELVALAADAALFHSPEGEAFATVQIEGHYETWPLRTKAFRRWLARRFYDEQDRAPGTHALQDAITVLEGKALFDGPEYSVFTRLAEYEGAIYLDLANSAWEAVEITASGWSVVANPPVKFRRMRGMLPLPSPLPGGSWDDLRPFVNLKEPSDWVLLKAWMVQALRPQGPYPVLIFHGEQGSAKSTHERVIRATIDPNTVPLRAEPRDLRDVMIAATNAWILSFDNLSHLPAWLSDVFCRLATGGGFSTRELYTDQEEALFDVQRPLALNGIEELATRGDLLDRAIILYLPAIPEERRRPEAEFWRAFEQKRPCILGALLDAVSEALRNVEAVRLERLPRMADFAVWAAAAAPKLGHTVEEFTEAYTGNREAANELTLEASLLTPSLKAVAETGFTGTATELLIRLNDKAADDIRRQKGWPTNGRVLSNALRRIAPNLRAVGVNVGFERQGKKRTRTVTVSGVSHPTQPEQAAKSSSAPSAASATQETTRKDTGVQADGTADATPAADAGNAEGDATRMPAKEHVSHWNIKRSGEADEADARKQTHSRIEYEEI